MAKKTIGYAVWDTRNNNIVTTENKCIVIGLDYKYIKSSIRTLNMLDGDYKSIKVTIQPAR